MGALRGHIVPTEPAEERKTQVSLREVRCLLYVPLLLGCLVCCTGAFEIQNKCGSQSS